MGGFGERRHVIGFGEGGGVKLRVGCAKVEL